MSGVLIIYASVCGVGVLLFFFEKGLERKSKEKPIHPALVFTPTDLNTGKAMKSSPMREGQREIDLEQNGVESYGSNMQPNSQIQLIDH
jgi:hypothetical protein